jgi:hypothetical protein
MVIIVDLYSTHGTKCKGTCGYYIVVATETLVVIWLV